MSEIKPDEEQREILLKARELLDLVYLRIKASRSEKQRQRYLRIFTALFSAYARVLTGLPEKVAEEQDLVKLLEKIPLLALKEPEKMGLLAFKEMLRKRGKRSKPAGTVLEKPVKTASETIIMGI
ncbi:MAG: hypothetical protein QXI42_02300 [Thermoproteota archaeon]